MKSCGDWWNFGGIVRGGGKGKDSWETEDSQRFSRILGPPNTIKPINLDLDQEIKNPPHSKQSIKHKTSQSHHMNMKCWLWLTNQYTNNHDDNNDVNNDDNNDMKWRPNLEFGQWDDVTVVRSVPDGALRCRVVVIETRRLVVEQLPPLTVRRPLPASTTTTSATTSTTTSTSASIYKCLPIATMNWNIQSSICMCVCVCVCVCVTCWRRRRRRRRILNLGWGKEGKG